MMLSILWERSEAQDPRSISEGILRNRFRSSQDGGL